MNRIHFDPLKTPKAAKKMLFYFQQPALKTLADSAIGPIHDLPALFFLFLAYLADDS